MQFKKREKKPIGLDLTPLIDVVFLLLLFFMVSTTFVNNPGIKLNLPEATTQPLTKPPKTIEIQITADHRIFISGRSIPASRLKVALQLLVKDQPRPVLILADGQARHEMVVYVMDQATQAGLTKLSIATKEKR